MDPTDNPHTFGKEILLRLHGAGFQVHQITPADQDALYVHISGRYASLGYSALSQEAGNPDAPVDEELSLFFGHDMKSDASITANFSGPKARVTRSFLPPSVIDTFARYEHFRNYSTQKVVDTMLTYFLEHEQPPDSAPPSSPTSGQTLESLLK